MSDNLGSQPGGRLLALPPEVRLLIYEMIFPPCRIGLYAAGVDFRWGREDQDRHPALLATCRTIYAEAKPVLYGNTEFHVWLKYGPGPEPTDEEDSLLEDSEEDDASEEDFPAVKPLINEMRKLSLEITLTDAGKWANSEDKIKCHRSLTSELTSLSEAPHLKHVHIELSASDGPGIVTEVYQMISLLAGVMRRITPTISIPPSLQHTDFEPSTYFDLIAKLNWADTTHEVYSKKLADLENKSSLALRKAKDESTRVAAKSAEHRDIVNDANFHVGNSDLWKQGRSVSGEIGLGLRRISTLERGIERLQVDIESTKEDLHWIAEIRSAHAEAEVAGTGEAPIVVD